MRYEIIPFAIYSIADADGVKSSWHQCAAAGLTPNKSIDLRDWVGVAYFLWGHHPNDEEDYSSF